MILHISNAFLGSKVHKNLYGNLDRAGITQQVFTVVREYKAPKKENMVSFLKSESKIVIAKSKLKTHHRFFFQRKTTMLYNDLLSQINIDKVSCTHATTLFTDGALAYKLFREKKIPYIVTVRNTDINYFLRLRPDLFVLAKAIIANAKFVTFLSPGLKEKFLSHWLFKASRRALESKIKIIYNGIEDFWIDNKCLEGNIDLHVQKPNKLLFVGRISKEKNLSRLINAVIGLRKENPSLTLSLVGPWGNDEKDIRSLVRANSNAVKYLGEIKAQKELLKIYQRHHVFCMPSTKESFGLVYLEALTQGLPVMYTSGQGFDGVISDKVGEGVVASNAMEVKKGLALLLNQYETYTPSQINFEQFRWEYIAKHYISLYNEI